MQSVFSLCLQFQKSLMIQQLRFIQNILYILCLFFVLQGTAQEETLVVPDSLKGKSYDYLYEKIRENQKDTTTSLFYTNTYLAKAIEEDNGYRRMVAYRSLIYFAKEKEEKYDYIEKSLGELGSLDDANKLYLFMDRVKLSLLGDPSYYVRTLAHKEILTKKVTWNLVAEPLRYKQDIQVTSVQILLEIQGLN